MWWNSKFMWKSELFWNSKRKIYLLEKKTIEFIEDNIRYTFVRKIEKVIKALYCSKWIKLSWKK